MKNPNFTPTGTPPKLFPIIIQGFNAIANHWYLILFPVFMDLLLWLGPKLKIKALLMPFISLMTDNLSKMSTTETVNAVTAYQKLLEQMADQFNLGSLLRTVPIGVPSLIARESPVNSPLGTGLVFEVPFNYVFAIILVLLLLGIFLGSIYFLLLSRVTTEENDKLTAKEVFSVYLQSLVLFCLLIILAVIILLPASLLLSILAMINLGIGQFLMLVGLFILVWLLIPLVFSPHGLFVLKQKALPSMLISVRLVRMFLPGTGLFVFTSILISEGLDMLWTLPETSSWMTLVGIGGHAFVITGLLAASFLYYREGLQWMQGNLQKMAEMAKMQQQNGGNSLDQ
jgi:hypothetical protein